jgi:hypothetical protein
MLPAPLTPSAAQFCLVARKICRHIVEGFVPDCTGKDSRRMNGPDVPLLVTTPNRPRLLRLLVLGV